ncbi:hypothetical protein V6N13_098667 [Hibiscus sabdariffa]
MPDLSPSGDFRLPKKQRRRDETPPDWIHEPAITPPIDCDKPLSNPVPHPSAVSYKDAVMGDRTTDPDDSPSPDTKVREAPTPEPLDAYGPWILVESRCPRSARVSKQPNHLDTAQIASQSRYNPIFAESNPTTQSPVIVDNRVNEPVAPAFHPMHDDMIQTSTATTTNVYPSFAPSPSATKSKSNGKAPVVIRKTPQAVLKPRDTNIMLKKNVGVSVWTGAAKKSSLNPDKHSIIVTSKSADPIILHNSNPKQLPSSPITDTQASST